MRCSLRRLRLVTCALFAIPAVLAAQTRDVPEGAGSVIARHAVVGAPFVAEVAVTIPRLMGATPTTYQGRERYARDGEGRVRVDQFLVPASGGQSGSAARSFIQSDPAKPRTLYVNHAKRLVIDANVGLARMFVGGDSSYVIATGPQDSLSAFGAARTQAFHGLTGDDVREEALGSRRIAGVEAIGRRLTVVLPIGVERNDAPIEIVEERWESEALQLTLYARLVDPRFGVSEYRVTSLARVEPSTEQFAWPDGYVAGSINPGHVVGWEFWRNPPRSRR